MAKVKMTNGTGPGVRFYLTPGPVPFVIFFKGWQKII